MSNKQVISIDILDRNQFGSAGYRTIRLNSAIVIPPKNISHYRPSRYVIIAVCVLYDAGDVLDDVERI